MPSDVTLVLFHSSLIYHFILFISYITQIFTVDLILSIFSVYLHFHCCQADSLLMHWGELKWYNWWVLTPLSYLTFHCVHLEWTLELFIYCGVFAQSWNCGGRETAVAR
jgi:hypothetical protein